MDTSEEEDGLQLDQEQSPSAKLARNMSPVVSGVGSRKKRVERLRQFVAERDALLD
jgi:hypothetical protein